MMHTFEQLDRFSWSNISSSCKRVKTTPNRSSTSISETPSTRRRILSCTRSGQLTPVLAILLHCNLIVAAEDVNFNDYIPDVEQTDGEAIADEWYMVIVFSLLFGFFITLFGSVFGYFSVLVDALMRRYFEKGDIVRADIVSTEFARRGARSPMCASDNDSDDAEYIAFVKYTRQIAPMYVAQLQKQVRIHESDIIRRRPAETRKSIPEEVGSPLRISEKDDSSLTGSNFGSQLVTKEDQLLDGSWDALELYVLPDHPKSGYPRAQVERTCSFRFRLFTILFVVFDFALAAFCVALAIKAILDTEEESQRQTGWVAIAIFSFLMLLEVPLIHFTMRNCFSSAIKEEYLESGEYIPLDDADYSSLSSGSDTYLNMTRMAAASPMSHSASVRIAP